MSNKAQELINALGAMAETSGILLTQLVKNGFTRDEAVDMCKTYLAAAITRNSGGNNSE